MKKVIVTLGVGVLALVLLSFAFRNNCENREDDSVHYIIKEHNPFAEGMRLEAEVASLKVEDLDLIEVEEEIELGLDVTSHLPKGFNAYAGMIITNNPLSEFSFNEEKESSYFSEEALLTINEAYHIFAEGMLLEKNAASLKVEDISIVEIQDDLELGIRSNAEKDFILTSM